MWPRKRHWLFWETPNDTGSGEPAPGTGEESGGIDVGSTAGSENTGADNQPPQTIPYSRFKEVNDARRAAEEAALPYRELSDAGYKPEDLHRLASWEMEFADQPVQIITNLVNAAGEGLPDEVKQQLLTTLEGSKGEVVKEGAADPSSSSDGTTPPVDMSEEEWWARAPEDVKTMFQQYQSDRAAQEQQAVSSTMDKMLEAWDEADKDLEIKTPKGSQIAWIAIAARDESDPVQILQKAREFYLADRTELAESILGEARTGNGDLPRTVPGGGSGAASGTKPEKPSSLRDATKRAEAAAQRGTLVMND